MNIYDKQGNIILNITPSDDSFRTRRIRGEDDVTLIFSLPQFVDIPVGSYIDYEGQCYTLWRPEDFTKNGSRIWEYNVRFGSYKEYLKTQKYKLIPAMPYELKFLITAKPDVLVQLLVDNLNLYDSGWQKGEVIEAPEKLISINYEWCYDVLQRLADEFDTEWEIVGKVIHLRKVERFKDNPLPLKYGKGNGLRPGIERRVNREKPPVTVLYVQGGERNINFSEYGCKTLRLPESQSITYEGRTYQSDERGMSVRRSDRPLETHNEDGYDGSHIYPSRVGEVTEVIIVDAENHYYDFRDATIPEDLNFRDCRIPGEKATIIFQSGSLAGREFNLDQTEDDLTGYIHAERRFRLAPLEEDGAVFPNENAMPHVGDKYAIFHISLPQGYICDNTTQTGASWDLFREAVRYMYENEDEQFSITGEMSSLFAQDNWLNIGGRMVLGSYISFSDDEFMPQPALIRITGITEPVNTPHKPRLELSNVQVAGYLGSALGRLEAEEVVRESRFSESIRYAKRTWRDAVETLGIMEESLLKNFTESINPITIRTMAALIGDESLQFRFVNSKTNPVPVEHRIIFSDSSQTLHAPAGIIQHMTMGINSVAPSHAVNEYKFWDIPAFTSPPLEGEKKYWLYAKVSAASQSGTFHLSETAIAMDAQSGYFYLWVGFLNSAYEGKRTDFVNVNRYTEILPGLITTSVIRDSLARLVVDLENARITAQEGAEIIGKITFSGGTTGYDNISDKPNITALISSATSNLLNYIEYSFADGLIDAMEASQIASLLNILASEKAGIDAGYNVLYVNPLLTGTARSNLYNAKSDFNSKYSSLVTAINNAIADNEITAVEKAAVNTAFTNYQAAIATYQTRYEEAHTYINGVINTNAGDALTAAQNASNTANNAQTTANGNAKVFYATSPPTSGMKLNDLWVDGKNIYRYNGSSWALASEYDVTKTVINGGLITTGAIAFGSTGGMSASGTIRIWSGGNSGLNGEPPSSPTFLVDLNGHVTSRGSYNIANANGDKLAGMTGNGTAATSIRIWAGASDLTVAPFRVTQDGSLYASKANITGTITASAGKIGGFTLSGQWLTTDANVSGNAGYILMAGTNTRIAFGQDLMPGILGGGTTCTAIITNKNKGVNNTNALVLTAAGTMSGETYSVRSRALIANGGVFIGGALCVFDDIAAGVTLSNSSGSDASFLTYCRKFIYNPGSNVSTTVYLPGRAAIESLFTGDLAASDAYNWQGKHVGYQSWIELDIICHRAAAGRVRVSSPASGTDIVGNDGSVQSYVDLMAGDIITFCYNNSAWYIKPFT